jgi:hypothetical protein
MNERRREAAHLGRRLARHRQREARTAVALLELERRPGYRVLDAGTRGPAGAYAAARAARDRLWRDYARYTGDLAAAERIRDRRRHRRRAAADADALRRSLDGADAVVAEVGAGLDELGAFATRCERARSSVLDALAPVAERLVRARHALASLELVDDDPDAVAARELTARAAAIERVAADDPLRAGPVSPLGDAVGALCLRLDELVRLRATWSTVPADLGREIDAVAARRTRVTRARARAGAELRDTVPARPPDRGPELHALREAVTAATGWRERHDAVVALTGRLAEARRELDATAALVAQLLDRRDDLRGRFGAYRARARRLGRDDDPELTELAGRIGTRLWAVPSEIARATRDLAAYRRRLALLGAR